MTEFEQAVMGKLNEIASLLARGSGGGSTLSGPPARQNVTAPEPKVASAYELDGQYGDPVVKKLPPKWDGEDFVGRKFSECSLEFLERFANFKEWSAANPREGDNPKWKMYAESDAAKARGWAARIRASGATPSGVDHGARETARTSSANRGGGYGGGHRVEAPADASGYEVAGASFGNDEDIPFLSSDPRHDSRRWSL